MWKYVDISQELSKEAREKKYKQFTLHAGASKINLADLVVREFGAGKYICDFFLNFPLDDDDAPDAFRGLFKLFRKKLKVTQAISFNGKKCIDLKNAGVLSWEKKAWCLVTPTALDLKQARQAWKQ